MLSTEAACAIIPLFLRTLQQPTCHKLWSEQGKPTISALLS